MVEINRFTINFSYYTDGIGRFEPFDKDEPSKPLAVWFNGSSVIIGDDAKREAKRETPNAFYDLLGWMQRQGHFDYASEKHDYNKLILYVIRAGLRDFYARILLNSKGSLDENMSHIPLLISTGPDIEDNESSVIINQLHDNGFGNLTKLDFDRFIIDTYGKKDDFYLILSGFGDDIVGKIYSPGHEDRFLLRNAGKDPRVDKLARLIWERTQAENNYLEFNDEIDELRRAAKDFIYSGESEADSYIVLSDGSEYSYYLTSDDMRLFNQDDSALFMNELVNRVNQYTSRQHCKVVLKGVLATNKYLLEKLRPEFYDIRVMGKDDMRTVLNKIVEWCKIKKFRFGKGSNVNDGEVVIPNHVCRQRDIIRETPNPEPLSSPSKRDERDFRILKKQVEAYKHGGEYGKALAIAEDFERQVHGRDLNIFDDELGKIIKELKNVIDKKSSVSPVDERKFKRLEKIVAVYVKNAEFDNAIEEIDNLKNDFARNEITAFDKKLELLRTEVLAMRKTKAKITIAPATPKLKPPVQKPVPSRKVRSGTVKNEDEGLKLMKEGKYKEARDKFRLENRKDEANDCTEIIKWQRVFAIYKAEVASITKTGNKQKAKSRINEIRTYVSLYKKYGVSTDELMLTIKELEKVK